MKTAVKLVLDFPHAKAYLKEASLHLFFKHSEGGYTANVPHPNNPQGRLAVLLLASDAEAGKFILAGKGRIDESDLAGILNGTVMIAYKKTEIEGADQ